GERDVGELLVRLDAGEPHGQGEPAQPREYREVECPRVVGERGVVLDFLYLRADEEMLPRGGADRELDGRDGACPDAAEIAVEERNAGAARPAARGRGAAQDAVRRERDE